MFAKRQMIYPKLIARMHHYHRDYKSVHCNINIHAFLNHIRSFSVWCPGEQNISKDNDGAFFFYLFGLCSSILIQEAMVPGAINLTLRQRSPQHHNTILSTSAQYLAVDKNICIIFHIFKKNQKNLLLL